MSENGVSNSNDRREELLNRIQKIYNEENQDFGYGKFYQSLPELDIEGMRPTETRISKYEFSRFLNNKQDVLDLGCNCGFLDISVADHVKTVTGVEYNNTLVRIADEVAKYLNKQNVTFINDDYNNWRKHNTKQYDVVFSFAVHHWFGVTPYGYAKDLSKIIKTGGILYFESQDVTGDKIYKKIVDELLLRNFSLEHEGSDMDDGMYERHYYVLKKQGDKAKYFSKKIKSFFGA